MKLVTFITIICVLLVMVFLTTSNAVGNRGSYSHNSVALKLMMAQR
jgi:hypothetical protein